MHTKIHSAIAGISHRKRYFMRVSQALMPRSIERITKVFPDFKKKKRKHKYEQRKIEFYSNCTNESFKETYHHQVFF